MKTFIQILGWLVLLLGVLFVFFGVMGALSELGVGSLSVVIGGGIFIALGITTFILNK